MIIGSLVIFLGVALAVIIMQNKTEDMQSLDNQIEESPQSETDFYITMMNAYSHEGKAALSKYIEISQNTYLEPAPINRKEAKSLIEAIYKLEGLAPPLIIWTRSPLSCVCATLMIEGLSNRGSTPEALSQIIRHWDSISDEDEGDKRIWKAAWNSIKDSQWLTKKPTTGEFLRLKKREKFTASNWIGFGGDCDFYWFQEKYFHSNAMLRNTELTSPIILYRTILDYVRVTALKLTKSELSSLGHRNDLSYKERYGQICAMLNNYQDDFGAFIFEYFSEEIENKTSKKFEIEYLDLYKSVGWVLPFENICLVTEPHTEMHLDNHHSLHNERGPAVTYPDGYDVYIWRGRGIPKEWIINQPTVQDALTWRDTEQRRIAVEILGWDNILNELGAIILDKDDDPQIGELLSVDLPDIGREKFLRVTCGTGRKFTLPVPPHMKTAQQANAWTWGLKPKQYKPEVRT